MLVHTGQHYDFKMSSVFFRDLDIPKPQVHLSVGSGSHASQTARIMTAFEQVVLKVKPAMVIVVGDVNSTLACSLAASKLHIPVAHVEAGLRSFDRRMPEEINRIATDRISDHLFVTEESGVKNLLKEGVSKKHIHFTGNVMIDALFQSLAKVRSSKVLDKLHLKSKSYAVVTLHRPSNVDSKESLSRVLKILEAVSLQTPLVFPIHPRTRAQMKRFGFDRYLNALESLTLIEPLGYVDFVRLVKDSKFVLTDSGGIQEEATMLKVPCLTMRENTERPSTIHQGTSELVGQDMKKILSATRKALSGKWKKSGFPRHWDGKAAERIARIVSLRLS